VETGNIEAPRIVRFMTYNIRNAHPDAGHEWADRMPLVATMIRRNDPDVIALQEVLHPQLRDLTAELADYDYVGVSRLGGTDDEYCPVFWRRDLFELLDHGQFWLSDAPDEPVSNTWNGLVPRIATWAVLRRTDGTRFAVAGTHFDHEENAHGDEVRRRSAALVAERMAAFELPTVVMGDLNAAPGSTAHEAFEDAGFSDVVGELGASAEGTFHDYSPWSPEFERIDWVLRADGIHPRHVHVDHGGDLSWHASDHFPVVADLQF